MWDTSTLGGGGVSCGAISTHLHHFKPMNAQEIATMAHEGQFRRDGVTPYIKHPEEVASFFNEGTSLWQIAWLHDVLEDTSLTEGCLNHYGIDLFVIQAVKLLTHRKNVSYEGYIERLKDATGRFQSVAADLAKRVKLIDIAVNLGDSPTPKQVKKYAEALKVLCS